MGNRQLTLVAAGAGVALAALTLVAATTRSIPGWERSLALDVYRWPGWLTPLLEGIMQAGTRLAALIAAALALLTRRWRLAVAFVVAAFAADLVSDALKDLVDRPRPELATLGARPREVVSGAGFPSTHTAIAAALVAVVSTRVDLARALMIPLAAILLLTALARLHLGVHWPLDVLGGAALGVLIGALAALAVDRA